MIELGHDGFDAFMFLWVGGHDDGTAGGVGLDAGLREHELQGGGEGGGVGEADAVDLGGAIGAGSDIEGFHEFGDAIMFVSVTGHGHGFGGDIADDRCAGEGGGEDTGGG